MILGQNVNSDELKSLISDIGISRAGHLDYLEFATFSLPKVTLLSAKNVITFFSVLDVNEDGFIGQEEIFRVIDDPEVRSENSWANVLLKYDANRDGKLEFEEFKLFLSDNSC
jgi:Ca2+-binding EF-hand superfamily protein